MQDMPTHEAMRRAAKTILTIEGLPESVYHAARELLETSTPDVAWERLLRESKDAGDSPGYKALTVAIARAWHDR